MQRVTDRLGEGGGTWDAAELFGEPDMHGLDEWPAFMISHALTFLGGVIANAGLDRVQLGDPLHRFFRDRRFGRDEHIVELPSRMSPTESELWDIAGGIGDQASKPGIAVDLDQATVPFQMFRRVNAFAVVAVNIDGGRVAGPTPGAVVDGVTPQPTGFGSPPAGVQHRQSCVVGEDFRRRQHGGHHQLVQWSEPPAGAADPVAQSGTIQRHAMAGEDLGLAIKCCTADYVAETLAVP